MNEKFPYSNGYLIYTRKSTDDSENQKNSIGHQKAEGLKYCQQEKLLCADCTIENFCTDGVIIERHTGFKESVDFSIGVHGVKHTIERPKFHKLVELLWKGHFKGVIFLCWDRASRNKSDNAIIHRLLEQGVDIRFVQATYDKSSAGDLHMDIDGMFAQHYSRVISEKVKNTNIKLRNEGVCIYRAPIGYLNPGNSKNKPFDPIRAPIVKKLFQKYAEGTWSLRDLVRYANTQGLTMPPVRRKRTKEELLQDEEVNIEAISRPLTETNVHTVLTNHFYTGHIIGNNSSIVKSISHEALISTTLFNKVQQELNRKKVSVHYTQKLSYPYRGMLRCRSCGRVYTPYEQKGICYYGVRCSKECHNNRKNVNVTFIEKGIGDIINTFQFNEQQLHEIDTRISSETTDIETQRNNIKEEVQREQKRVKEELAYLQSSKLLLLKTSVYSPEDYLSEENALQVKLGYLDKKMKDSESSLSEMMKDVVILSELVKTLYSYYLNANPYEKMEIMSKLFSELYLFEETFTFQCKNGFMFLSNSSVLLGSPKTWLSELLSKKDDIKICIEVLENNIASE